ncbi:hypothetical protein EWM64_g4622 [Hericium alpestre]|uniref:laccase n=1 Tax=Hericium alpestre TaxID=135208 RepID=A0A4Y9ZWY0_9AGAM|nr:hypothetical protein EWM64_g4622 [Hericium alpestre]
MYQLLLLLPLLAQLSLAWQPDHVLRIASGPVAADCTVRNSAVINGTSPGPTIRLKEGDHVWIRVYNDMEGSNTTLHWHGISQYLSPFADGTPQTSQWPIAPGGYFDYEFLLQPGSAGTYMYHTHVGVQIVTAYGALIVEEAKPPFAYDADLILLLGDFWHASDANITKGLLGTPFTWPNDPQALTVNGNAFGQCTGAACRAGCHTEVLNVLPETTYRVRMIGAMGLSFIYTSIDAHSPFTVIELDGGYIAAHNASYLEISSGQRVSFLLRTKSAAELRALNQTDFWANIETRWRSTRDYGAWILRYNLTQDDFPTLDPYAPIPALNKTVPLPDEAPYWITNDLSAGNGSTLGVYWVVDQYQYTENWPQVPYLVQAYENKLHPDYEGALANGGFDNSTNSIPIHINETVDLVFLNLASFVGTLEAHPWHIHGAHPFLMAQGLGEFSDDAYTAARQNRTGQPYRLDTGVGACISSAVLPLSHYSSFSVPQPTRRRLFTEQHHGPARHERRWMVYRLSAVDAGAFLLHCHIQPHMTMGMATVLLIGMENLPSLPKGFLGEFMAYNSTRTLAAGAQPAGYFELVEGL